MSWKGYERGRRVVCITPGTQYPPVCSAWPKQGHVYTIRDTDIVENQWREAILGLRFEEFRSERIGEFADIGGEWWFAAKDFRPLDEGRLDQFRALLSQAPKTEVLS